MKPVGRDDGRDASVPMRHSRRRARDPGSRAGRPALALEAQDPPVCLLGSLVIR